ncbi:Ddi1p [Kluyveromyces lactis]|uniref:DNA damage-inducible protein 1 n=1 Tax=Kluyveromyces lactis (strain ATCC 8585 / CBS 2359 / DSM 70799 / NBRC 1267 / NRRL Y-1140 / WM37) TaxID=284590 RepID=DDI1_KLULA|nr:uncharacterized protein KLLA0_E10341g [Kluyveromyces lactis]Q6CNS3.1 RecName: Full=DNA damage-inducible protein 1 [Kluyveromyces lactis NRRL Y-1140]CAG99503.1 KLLA0E10341p [Kluyveromyces lactis]|eukprot:XP_454416.1 uncharacterized protein KLLA0_E10341g [Kluyveromyces lactis]
MNITVTYEHSDDVLGPFELSEDMSLIDLFALIDFKEESQIIFHNMKQLDTKNTNITLKEAGLQNHDMLLIKPKNPASSQAAFGQPQEIDLTDEQYIEQFRTFLLENPSMAQEMGLPNLEHMINNKTQFHQLLGPVLLSRRGERSNNPFGIPNSEYSRLMSNPDDPVNQARISELTNQHEIDEQLRYAMEYTPESFTQVSMLYIKLEINGHPVKAFVDSGAQQTIMSTKLAERTGLTSLIDKRFSGIAQGVGTGKILGRIHTTQIKIHDVFLPCSFTVLDTPMEMLLGLDMLRRHQASIDLKNNVLRISDVETPFLPESEIPKDSLHALTTPAADEVRKAALKRDSSSGKNAMTGDANKVKQPKIPSSTTNQTVPSFAESDIKKLVDLGFSRKEAINALNKTGGNVDYAASLLFQ